jgi:hypothetical protein
MFLIILAWGSWYRETATVNPLTLPFRIRMCLFAAPVVCALITLAVLLTLGAKDVRHDPTYIAFYLFVSSAWLGGTTLFFPFLGVSARDDVLERGHRAALAPVCGALLGAAFSFAGANIGDGPGAEAVLFSGLLSSGAFFAFWFAAERLTLISEVITIERNVGAGMRLGGFLVGLGLLSGWAVAGDWESWFATVRDLIYSLCPGLVLCGMMVAIELFLKNRKPRPAPGIDASIGIAVVYIALACGWVLLRGVPS